MPAAISIAPFHSIISGFTNTVYRVQHAKDGRGPYRPGLTELWAYSPEGEDPDEYDATHPPLSEEIGVAKLTAAVRACNELRLHLGHAFSSMDQLMRWFNEVELRTLKGIGFNVVELDQAAIVVSTQHQVLFARTIPHTQQAKVVYPLGKHSVHKH